MIKRAATILHDRYIEARQSDGTATGDETSVSAPLFHAIKAQGLLGIVQGIKDTRSSLKLDESHLPLLVREGLFWGYVMVLGPIQFMLIIAGFRGRGGGNWQWLRDLFVDY